MSKSKKPKKAVASLAAPELPSGREFFRQWVDRHVDPGWDLMPLTHITKGIVAQQIIADGVISPQLCKVFKQDLSYFFYGRPAYRVSGDGSIKREAASPFCFIFTPDLIHSAKAIFALDTGAFEKRLYKHAMMDEMTLADFSLEKDVTRPNRVISAVFASKADYMDGAFSAVAHPDHGAEPGEFHAKAYLQLLSSPGRNEPDDRIGTIEVIHGQPVNLNGNLKAAIVPHTLWNNRYRTPWLEALQVAGVDVVPYIFLPNRHPDYYVGQIELAVRELYGQRGWL